MNKTLLIYVLLSVIFSATQGTEVERENASKLLSNLFVMFSGLTIISIMLIFNDFIYVCMHKVSKILVYKLQDLYTIYRSMSCAIFSILVTVLKVLGILVTYICTNFSIISTLCRCV